MMYYKVLVCLTICIVIAKCQRSRCPDTNLCFCEGSVLECNCTRSSSLVLRSFSKFAHKIIVEGCEDVEIQLGAFINMEITYMEFKNINKLIRENLVILQMILGREDFKSTKQ
ncbi:uncharacterized protein TNIN_82441 [Trichonephila inaurata madagascariensis]|uniref:Uncharacterized protein n=1 Tax=Trichonephila inaurata madagascariensis TaxID=2747483 RepID=A0A8X6XLR4_9ARAC|nr:uncharacterized protein TNIN_82441 [Trichonephila inaurata madagascariensis]